MNATTTAPRRRSLRAVLARQWVVFGLLLFAGFAAMALLLLFMLEDAFIDRRLREVASGVQAGALQLPDRFERFLRADAPAAIRERTHDQRAGVIREFRLPDGRYVHVLADGDGEGAPFLLVYDVSDQLAVNAALAQAWPWLLAIAGLLAALGWALATRFADDIGRRAATLVREFADADAPGGLQALAERADVAEFADVAALGAEAWAQKLAALERERETLAFLAHELRTPLQSSRTSLALLQDDRTNEAAWQRLQRAQERLARASQAMLWLAGDAALPADASSDAPALVAALAAEFASLAATRGQTLVVDMAAETSWPVPPEVAEIVLANLLLNAIRHGGAGTIAIAADAAGLHIANPVGDGGGGGFGLGLEIVTRLLERCGGRVDIDAAGSAGKVTAAVQWRAPARQPATMTTRTCPHCGEATLPAWKVSFGGAGVPLRCPRCGGKTGIAPAPWAALVTFAAMLAAIFLVLVFVEAATEWQVAAIPVLVFLGYAAWYGRRARLQPLTASGPRPLLFPAACAAAVAAPLPLLAYSLLFGKTMEPQAMAGLWIMSAMAVQFVGAPTLWLLRRTGILRAWTLAAGCAAGSMLLLGLLVQPSTAKMLAIGVSAAFGAFVFWRVARKALSWRP